MGGLYGHAGRQVGTGFAFANHLELTVGLAQDQVGCNAEKESESFKLGIINIGLSNKK